MQGVNYGSIVRLVMLFVVATIGWRVMEATTYAVPTYLCCGNSTACTGCVVIDPTLNPVSYIQVGTNAWKQCSFSSSVPPNSSCFDLTSVCYTTNGATVIYSDSSCLIQAPNLFIGKVYKDKCNSFPSCP